MNLPRFLSQRISTGQTGTFSHSIYRIAVITIAVGITSLLLAFSVLGGFKDKIREKVYAFSGQLQVSKYTLSTSYEDAYIELNDTLISTLNVQEYVTRWQAFAYKAGLLKTEEEVQGVIFKGIDQRFDTTYFKEHLIEGRLPKLGQPSYTTEVAISRYISNFLNLKEGNEVLIYFVQNPPRYRKLTIVGIYETGLEEFDQKLILGDLQLIRRLNNWKSSQASGIEVFINDKKNIYDAQEHLFYQLPAELYVENVRDKYLQIFDWLDLLNRNVLVFLILIMVVACFSMVSVLLILIMERTQMVGMLKALGADDRLIRTVFIQVGVRLILTGLLLGNVVGIGIASIQYFLKLIPLDPVNYYMSYVPISFDWLSIIGINILFVTLIIGSLMIPVTIISRIRPIQAIRFD